MKVSVRWGCSAKARQMRLTVLWLRPESRAMDRVLQWVAALGVVSKGQRNHPLNVGIVNHPGATAARLVQQAVQPLFQESGPPFPHRVNAYPQLGGHPSVAPAIGAGQNDSGRRANPWAVLGRRVHCSKVSRSAPSRAKGAIGLPLPIFILPLLSSQEDIP